MLKILSFIFLINLLVTSRTFGQEVNKNTLPLYKVFSKNLRYPLDLHDKKITSIFSVKFILSTDNKIDSIIPSKYTPVALIETLIKKDLYNEVVWANIFNRKVKKGDYVIIPFALYLDSDNSTTIIEYTIDDIFNFSGARTDIMNGLLLQPYVMKTYPAIP